jgi:hypothetical protein
MGRSLLDNIPPDEAAWIILHECLGHLLRGHCAAAELYPDTSAAKLNLAQDLEVESWEWPSGPAQRPSAAFRGVHPSDFGLPVGETWEWYLHRLPDEHPVYAQINCGSGAHGRDQEWELGPDGAPVMPGSAYERAIRKAAAEKIREAAKERGDVPAGLEVWANVELAPPKVDWRQTLRTHAAQLIAAGVVDQIGSPRERYGILQPRWAAPRPKISIVADTSGSMSGEGGEVLRACVDICAAYGAVNVCWVDTEPQWQTVRSRSELRPVGGGGTDLCSAIEQARERRSEVIVIVTDCETPWPEPCSRSLVLAIGGGKPPEGWRVIKCQ